MIAKASPPTRKTSATPSKRLVSRSAIWLQDSVAARIAEAGMDRFEPVDVEQREGHVRETRSALFELLHQRDAIAQTGERIAQGAIERVRLRIPCAW